MDRIPHWAVLTVTLLLFIGALFAAYVGWLSAVLLCENGCTGTLGAIRTWVKALPIVGILPTALVVLLTYQRRCAWALAALVAALVLYGVWGWMLELLTHPMDHGIKF
jgi:hypothetical protein